MVSVGDLVVDLHHHWYWMSICTYGFDEQIALKAIITVFDIQDRAGIIRIGAILKSFVIDWKAWNRVWAGLWY